MIPYHLGLKFLGTMARSVCFRLAERVFFPVIVVGGLACFFPPGRPNCGNCRERVFRCGRALLVTCSIMCQEEGGLMKGRITSRWCQGEDNGGGHGVVGRAR